jgi:P-type Mg2+ transporter
LIIIAIVMFSVLLNFLMEFQARHAVEEIQKQIAISAVVIRDGQVQELPVAELVPGDIIRLKAGDLVPADARTGRWEIIFTNRTKRTRNNVIARAGSWAAV